MAEIVAAPIARVASLDAEAVLEKPRGGTVLRALLWLGGARWAAQLVMWASTLVVARLLAPEDYGLVAIAVVVSGFLEVVAPMGLGAALVQAKDLTERHIEAAMGATTLIGLVAAGMLVLGAPLWADLQGEPRVVPIVRVLALSVLLTGFCVVPNGVLQRRLAFSKLAQAQFVRGFATAVVTLASAFILQSYWAIVIGSVVGRACFTGMLTWAAPTAIRLPRRGSGVGRLLRFGALMTGERVIYHLRTNIDVAIVGALLGSRVVGLYGMAMALAMLPLERLGIAFAPVAYPTFSRLQDDKAELRRYFLALTLGTMAIAIPASVGLILTAPLLIPTIIGAQWREAILPLQIAAAVTPLLFHMTITNALLNAVGRVGINLRVTMWTTLLTIPAVIVGVKGGIVGVAIGSAAAVALVGIYGEFIAFRVIELSLRDAARTLWPVVSASIGMSLAVLYAAAVIPAHWADAVRLAIEVVAGAAAFVGWALLFHRRAVTDQLGALRAAWRNR